MAPYLFWIESLHQAQTTPFSQQFTGNQHTQTNTCIGTAITITAKNSVYNTLAHRAKVVSNTPEDLNKELEHLNKALKDCQFPNWALNKLQQQFLKKHNHNNNNNPLEEQTNNNRRDSNNEPTNKNISIVIPYIKGLGEKIKKTRHPGSLQGHRHCQTTTNGTQGQGP